MNDPYTVIKKPLITEKGTDLTAQNKYFFLVDKRANKIDIKRAVEKIFKVTVANVNTHILSGKKKRVRYREGLTAEKKKAIVTLKQGDSIDFSS